ncbi:MAG: phage holin family protein [Candidatus Moranbacteria bacterium]|nr:phage holin family protein [Candidatus Moranbacteria bacterium]
MKIILHWFLRALAIMITAYLLPGIILKSFFVALIVAVVLGLFNTILKPILIILTLPITILTLGLFTLVINAGMIMLTSKIVDGFYVQNFWWALFFSLILSLVNAILHSIEPSKNHDTGREHE